MHYLLAFCIGFVWPVRVLAEDSLDAAVRSTEDGQFEEALAQFERAIERGKLARSELVRLLSQRSLVWFALRRSEALELDLRFLLSIEPSFDFRGAAPPALLARFEALRGEVLPLKLSVDVSTVPGGVRVRTDASNVPAGISLRPYIGMRGATNQWQVTEGSELRYPTVGGAEVEYYAELRGPGGAVVAEDGSADAPRHYLAQVQPSSDATFATAPIAPASDANAPSDRRKRVWWGVGVGAVALVVAAVVVGIIVRAPTATSRTAVNGPAVEYP